MDERRKWFPETEASPGDDAVKTVGTTMKDLEYDINLVNRAAARFERMGSNSERSSTLGKMLSNSITSYREITSEKRVNR